MTMSGGSLCAGTCRLTNGSSASGTGCSGADRVIRRRYLFQQALRLSARADHARAAVANGAVHDPRPDGVHSRNLRQIDGQRIGFCGDLALGGCGARNR